MTRFSTAPIAEVARKTRSRQPSQRALIATQYLSALEGAVAENRALVVELEEGDKAPTIRNRVKRAVASLPPEDAEFMVVRRRGNTIIAYWQSPEIEEYARELEEAFA